MEYSIKENYKTHEKNDYPKLNIDDEKNLTESLKKGYIKDSPIWMYQGKILDGQHRFLLCKKLSVEPTFKEYEGDPEKLREFVDQLNARRNLTKDQKDAMAELRTKIEERNNFTPEKKAVVVEVQDDLTMDDTRPKKSRLNKRVNEEKQEENVELKKIERLERIKQGEATKKDIDKENRLEQIIKKQEEIFIKNKATKEKDFVDIFKTKKTYQIIYADPPWKFENGDPPQAGVNAQYATMQLKDIRELPVKKLCAVPCALILWVVFPLLKDGIEVLEAWGFEYKTLAFSWAKIMKNEKPVFGIGYYAKSNLEIALLGVKGNAHQLVKSNSVSSMIFAERKAHSEKPIEVSKRIVELFGDVPRIELFARDKKEGWDYWGNEV